MRKLLFSLLLFTMLMEQQQNFPGAGGVSPATGGVYATQLALNASTTLWMDTIEAGLNTCSVAGSPAIITCTANTFTCPGDATKVIWGVSNGTPGALAFAAPATIATCTDAKHVTVSTNTAVAGALSNLRFGHDDTPAWDAINSAYNTLLLTQGACLILPAGMTTVTHGTLLVSPTAGYNGAGPFAPCWKSLGLTYFSPTPDFNFYFYNAGASNIQFVGWGTGTCCKTGGPEQPVAEGIIVDGGTLNSGTGTCAVGASPQDGMFLGQMQTKKMGVVNWCDNVTGLVPIVFDNLGTHYDIMSINTGRGGVLTQGAAANAPVNFIGGQIACDVNSPSATNFTTSTSTRNVQFTCPKSAIEWQPGASTAVWRSDHDNFFQSGPTQNQQLIRLQTGSAWITDCWAQGSAGSSNALIFMNGSGVAHVKGCTLNAAAGQFWGDSTTTPGGTIYDDGGNRIIGSFASDAIPTGSNGIWGVGTGVATANTTLYLVPQAATTTLFTNTTATTSSGVAPFTGTLANLVCVSTAAGVNASSGVVTVRLAPLSTGTFAASTLTATFGTTTSAKDQTHTVAITQGQPIQFQITTQAAETLAGVQCRVSEY